LVKNAIEENATGPASAEVDGVRVNQHSIRDQIAADRHLRASEAAKKTPYGLRFAKLANPGAGD